VPPGRLLVGEQEWVSKRHSTVRDIVEHGLLDVPMDSLLKVTTVRNPFDSIVSKWLKLLHRPNRFSNKMVQRKQLDFAGYVARFWGDRPEESMHAEFVDGIDEVMRFETLHDDLARVLALVGAPVFELPRVNPTTQKTRHYSEYYDEKARAVIERVFRSDLERFGYEFERPPGSG